MRRGSVRRVAFVVGLVVGGMLALPGAAHATLQLLTPNPSVPATFVGKGGYSADGLGQGQPGGTLQAEVPAGSQVFRAYLYGSYFFNASPDANQRTINFDGTNVVLDLLPDSSVAGGDLVTARGEVTSQVAAKVGSGGGITDFAINNDPSNLNGLALVVIYSNPGSSDGTIAVLDGGSAQGGDTVTFPLAAPLDTTVPNFGAQLSLGSGHSFQGVNGHACGGGQFSTVEVNGQPLTNCAGNFDDGQGADGSLVTVGGVGDSINNPDPPPPAQPTEDDELYNLVPFLQQGVTSITLVTENPSQDDNLFLAVVQFNARVAGTVEICDNGIDEDGDGLVDLADDDCIAAAPSSCEGIRITGKSEIASGGNDTVTGTAGNDELSGAAGNDTVNGLEGSDCLFGNRNNDRINGDDGDDVIRAGRNKDTVNGNAGDDDIRLQEGPDVGNGGPGDDVIKAQAKRRGLDGGVDQVNCGPGKDRAIVDHWDKVAGNCDTVKVVN
jgi:Ca2+-binding RTX toxin-like protein